MDSKKIFITFALVALLLLGAYLLLNKQNSSEQAPINSPSPSASPTATLEPSPTPTSTESPTPTPEPTPLIEEPVSPTQPHQPKAIKKKVGPKPLMEVVDDSSSIGEETADGEGDISSKKTTELTAPTLSPSDTVEALMKDANHIVQGFEETDTDELVGVWTGTVKLPGKPASQIAMNRIWDHMTDEYLPSSCVAFMNGPKLVSAYLRLKTLDFYEKPSNKRSKLIVKLKSNYLFEFWAPIVGSHKTTGYLYQMKGTKLVQLGAVNLTKDLEATADTDCSYIE